MKQLIQTIVITVMVALSSSKINAQADVLNHSRSNGQYLGWDNVGTSGTLEIKNDFSQPINFSTNTAQKMSLTSGGNLGLSDSWTSFTPGNLLHLYKSGTSASLYTQWQNGNSTYSNGLKIGINASNEAEIKMVDAKDLKFYTDDNLSMTILGAPISGVGQAGNVGIGGTGYFAKFDVLDATSSTTTVYTGNFNSTNSNTIAVINAELNVDADIDTVAAVRGVSVYQYGGVDAGYGGYFKGGFIGAKGLVTSTLPIQLGLLGESRNATGTNIGVAGYASNLSSSYSNPMQNTGVIGSASGSKSANAGVRGFAIENPPLTGYSKLINAGVSGKALGSNGENRAGMFICEGTSGRNFAVWARTTFGPADPTIPFVHNSVKFYAGYFLGDVYMSNTTILASDSILKDSIQDLTGSLNILSQLQPKSFVFKNDSFPYMNLPQGPYHHMGLIAQQVDSVLPGLVKKVFGSEIRDANDSLLMDTMTFLGLNYTELIGLLVAGINEISDTMVTTCEPTTLTGRIPKWLNDSKMLCNSLIRDDGAHVGITNSTFPGDTLNPGATLSVFTDTDSAAIQGVGVVMGARFRGQDGGVVGFADGTNDNDFQAGVFGICENGRAGNTGVAGFTNAHTDTAINVGLFGNAGNSDRGNAGAYASSTSEGDTSINVGIYAQSGNSHNVNYAGWFNIPDTAGVNYAVYGMVKETDDTNSYAGYFHGNVYTSGAYLSPSDSKLKENITDVDNAMSILSRLQVKNYEFKTSEYPSMNLPQGRQYGLIAEEAERIVPDLVHDIVNPERRDTSSKFLGGKVLSDEIRFKGINYSGFIPLLISAIQQQQAIIDSMEKRLSVQEARSAPQFRMSGPASGEGENDSINRLTVELGSMQAVILDQNAPNPFAEQTSISYFIPEDAGSAQMMFFDISGRVLKTVDIEKGNGIITVFAPNLSSGTYSYSLLIDGKSIETKKMVKMK